MKKTIYLFIAMALVLGACKKRQTKTNCYVCRRDAALISNDRGIAIPRHNEGTDTLCNFNQGMVDYFVKSHNYMDTLSYNGETYQIRQQWEGCEVE